MKEKEDVESIIAMGTTIRNTIDRKSIDLMLLLDEIADALVFKPPHYEVFSGDSRMLLAAARGIREAIKRRGL